MNHSFKDDLLTTILTIKKYGTLLIASLPDLFNTLDGILLYLHSFVIENRKVPGSGQIGLDKSVLVLKAGSSIIICPEGVHNKTPNNSYAYKLIKDYYRNLPAYNCGVDVTEFEPRTLDELIILKEVNKNEPYIN